jgi:hypothetical protein
LCARREAVSFANTDHGMPRSKYEALTTGQWVYVKATPCMRAGHVGIRTIDGECWICKMEREAPKPLSPRQQAKAAGEITYASDNPCAACGSTIRLVSDCTCAACATVRHAKPCSSRQQAITDGLKWYTPAAPCPRCGTLAERRVSDGKCRGCMRVWEPAPMAPSPRKQAQADGKKWYIPAMPCPHCGTLAERYVANGRCRGC